MTQMPFQPGLVHAPVTPFTREHRIDFDLYGKLIAFHLAHGADALAVPMHAGESVSLSDDERRALLEYAIKRVAGRKPVIAHVSEAGTGVAAALARHAQSAGAAAIVATTPYYWTPPPAMVLEHFAQIGGAVDIPFLIYNAPEEMAGTRINTDLALKLIARIPNFAGVVDSSLDWQFMIELMTETPKRRPDFVLLAGNELLVSASAIGATGMVSSLAALAPKRVRQLYDLCRTQKLFEARDVQEEIAALHQVLKPGGVAALKAAMRTIGRDCGAPRPPNLPLDGDKAVTLAAQLDECAALRNEPRGW
jgi:4-hydroxy-tetrahydrodipicolinate synthase